MITLSKDNNEISRSTINKTQNRKRTVIAFVDIDCRESICIFIFERHVWNEESVVGTFERFYMKRKHDVQREVVLENHILNTDYFTKQIALMFLCSNCEIRSSPTTFFTQLNVK